MKAYLLDEYEQNLEKYRTLAQSMDSLISILLSSSDITPHSVSCRVKERSSLAKKIEKKDKYDSLDKITDIVGLRIISNYSDQVDQIAHIIENEFSIDIENSIDKRAGLDPDRFGYVSLHYVVSLTAERAKLVEYKRFDGMKFELQIRSILQHTWAEIEHDIGYKTRVEVPRPIRRKFSRLAGLLELADDQFIEIRDDLLAYEKSVQENMISEPESIWVDAVSLTEFINTSPQVKNLDAKIAIITNASFKALEKENAIRHVKYLQFFGIESISQLQRELEKNSDFILRRAHDINSEGALIGEGICIFYLHQVLAAKLADKGEILTFLDATGLGHVQERAALATYLFELGKEFL